MSDLGEIINWANGRLRGLNEKIDEQQTNVYIVAGVLGGVNLVLIIAAIVLVFAVVQIKKRIREMEIEKQLEEEMNAQKLAAYTGEELHRKLIAASNPAAPIGPAAPGKSGPDSEYAFNAPFVDNRVLGRQTSQMVGSSRFQRF